MTRTGRAKPEGIADLKSSADANGIDLGLLGRAEVLSAEAGRSIRIAGTVPDHLELFQDHFPGFPVLPGVLAVEILKKTAEYLLEAAGLTGGSGVSLSEAKAVKFASYLRPGDKWEGNLALVKHADGQSVFKGAITQEGHAAMSARLILQGRNHNGAS